MVLPSRGTSSAVGVVSTLIALCLVAAVLSGKEVVLGL
jgi:hypothetical protein